MKFAFVTCVQLGLSCIEKIYEVGGSLDLLITLHDHKAKNKSGRIYLDDFANQHKIDLFKINHINDQDVVEKIKRKNIDWLFIIGWSQIAGKEVLDAPNRGAIGMHPTLLPEGRGRAAIPWAILKGLDKTGVTMFKLDTGVDTGDIMGVYEISLSKETTATELYGKVNDAHQFLIEKVWDDLVTDRLELRKQNDALASYWEGRRPEDGQLNNSMTMGEAACLVRATTFPYPGAFFTTEDKKIIVWSGDVQKILPDNSQMHLKLKDGYLLPVEYEIVINH
ncbi:methionyl-tRNA formyltransferase [Pedobacter africanus]|uniref:Methionyl-tRNA formyltransferase n=1 Tax=Pedobacter africanus TaxID=151894 RepID=A0ACC6L4E1_9SPHI|nr:formyltransferase family protein [Pedobacter africanus]MDR6786153.1 methionyl-tRNA formyltransferase [Pedobacter africanus]